MQINNTPDDISGFSFRMDLMKLNLHLMECESPSETQTYAHETALARMRTLESRTQALG